MRISVNWLTSLVELTLSPEALAELLTIAGLEVEEIEDRRQWAQGVVVGKVLERAQHPNADKLSVCRVDVGAAEPLQIVCGASNVRADIFVPVALVGTYLPCIDLKLKPTKLRGERSEGMICSLAELGLEKTSAGIHIFTDNNLPPGLDVRPLLGLDDVILDISPTANRADALSMVGVAREVAALTGARLTLPSIPSITVAQANDLKIQVQEPSACPLYIGTVMEGITIAPSPAWLQQRLQAAGVRPINNVVDITNYVLLEWGQPLHAFDRERLQALAGSPDLRLGVRFAQAGESLLTLDEQLRSLTPQNLLITIQDKPVAIAGVMGGAETEVHAQTQNIVLESALFDGVTIRRSSKAQNLRSESSTRYERGVNQCELEQALARAIHLITELAGGQPIQQSQADARPRLASTAITLRLDRLNAILGPVQKDTGLGSLTGEEIERILMDLGCQLTPLSQTPLTWSVLVPSYRQRDIEREIDLIEEVARLYGYDHFVDQLPPQTLAGGLSLAYQRERLVREAFRGVGLTEVVHYSLVKPQGREVVLANPLLAEYSALRTNLLDGLIDALAYNLAQGNGALNGFEIGRIFWQDNQGIQEAEVVAGILGGELFPQGRWQRGGKPAPMTWYEAKGLLEQVFTRLGLSVEYQPDQKDSRLHPGRTASLWLKGQALGYFGQLHPQLRQERDLIEAVYGFELRLDILTAVLMTPQGSIPHFQAYSAYPAVERDLALFAPLDLTVADLTRVMTKAGGKLLAGVELFDDYRGEAVPSGQRSLAFSLAYRLQDRTLTDEDVEPVHNQIRAALKAEFAVTLRS
ncbi:phenylalanine--tRNA ligase subunit beta [Synechocystis sp. LKSZ1]|uniref:phenylalanine--tRNA ligase subunit beta n=1 Tax=Synechocystis sp. LKSZ1 TaxID=3144951 RepID=UPI00336C1AF6